MFELKAGLANLLDNLEFDNMSSKFDNLLDIFNWFCRPLNFSKRKASPNIPIKTTGMICKRNSSH